MQIWGTDGYNGRPVFCPVEVEMGSGFVTTKCFWFSIMGLSVSSFLAMLCLMDFVLDS